MTQPIPAAPRNVRWIKWLVPAGVGLAVLAIFGVIYGLLPRSVGPGLYVYYPEHTAFFMEMEASDAEAKGILTLVEREQARARRLLAAAGKAPVAVKPAFLGERLTQDFVETFKPQFSIGAWPVRPGVDRAESGNIRYLITLPLKSSRTTGEEIVAKIGAERFSRATFRKTPYWVEKKAAHSSVNDASNNDPMVIAVVNHVMLLTGSSQAMEDSLTQALDRRRNVFENPALKAGLSRLPAPRQGTALANSAAFAPSADSRAHQWTVIAPATFAALRMHPISKEGADPLLITRLTVDFLTPLKLDQVSAEGLRQDLRAFLAAPKNPFRAASFLPAKTEILLSLGRLDALGALVMDYGLDPQQQQSLMGAQFVLSMAQLDLRKDLLGLLKGEVALGGTLEMAGAPTGTSPAATKLDVAPLALFSRTDEKAQTVQKLLRLAGSGIASLRQKTEQMEGVSVETLTLPGQPIPMGVATLKKEMIAIGVASQLAQAARVVTGKTPSLAEQDLYRQMVQNLPREGVALAFVNLERAAREKDSPVRAIAGVADFSGDGALNGRMNLLLALPQQTSSPTERPVHGHTP